MTETISTKRAYPGREKDVQACVASLQAERATVKTLDVMDAVSAREKRLKRLALLRLHRICHPEQVLNAMEQPNRPTVSRCCAMLNNETAGWVGGQDWNGGANIFGGEGAYPAVYEQEVTPEREHEYLRLRFALGLNGANNTQITDAELQDEARARGGLYDCQATAEVGFGFLHLLIERYGPITGPERYNGSGPAAERYRQDFLAHEAEWERIFGAEGVQ